MTTYGTVQIGGKTFIEREQTFPLEITISTNNQVIPQASLVLPGQNDFWLKALTRDVLVSGAPATRRFKFRLGNSDGATWYQSGGTGGSTDRVIDALMFGNAQFPKVITPYIYYSASASIMYQIEDLSANAPYTIYFGFVGSYLIPA